MNVENINALADFIEGGSMHWDIGGYDTCYCGCAKEIGADDGLETFLGLEDMNEVTFGHLITPPGWHAAYEEIGHVNAEDERYTRDKAVAVLRNLARTGEVNWDIKVEA